mgnify:CR=1 FL=1
MEPFQSSRGGGAPLDFSFYVFFPFIFNFPFWFFFHLSLDVINIFGLDGGGLPLRHTLRIKLYIYIKNKLVLYVCLGCLNEDCQAACIDNGKY